MVPKLALFALVLLVGWTSCSVDASTLYAQEGHVVSISHLQALEAHFEAQIRLVTGIIGGPPSDELVMLYRDLIFGAGEDEAVTEQQQRDDAFSSLAPDGSPDVVMPPPSSPTPIAPPKCRNWETVVGGKCIPRTDTNANGAIKQGWTNGTKASFSLLIAIMFVARFVGIANYYKLEKRNGRSAKNMLTDFMCWGCFAGFISYMCSFFSVMVFIGTNGLNTTHALIAYLVLYAIYMGGSFVTTFLIAIHVFDEIALKLRRAGTDTAQPYSAFSKTVIWFALAYAFMYAGYLIAVTVKYKSAVPKWKDIEYQILAAGYIFQIFALLTHIVSFQYLSKTHHLHPEYRLYGILKRLVFWVTSAVFISIIAFAIIYWSLYGKNPINPNIPPESTGLLKIQTATVKEQDIRSTLNFCNYILMALALLFMGWNDLSTLSHFYYAFNLDELAQIKRSLKYQTDDSNNARNSHSSNGTIAKESSPRQPRNWSRRTRSKSATTDDTATSVHLSTLDPPSSVNVGDDAV